MNIHLSNLQHSYGKKSLLDFESLKITSDKATLITGANGSGKTTLLTILAGLRKADNLDELRISETKIDSKNQQKTLRQMATYMHQNPYMLQGSVIANLHMLCRWRGKQDDDDTRIARLLDSFQLADYGHSPAQQLSQGQQQRLAFIRSILSDAPLVLLDEPTANLDNDSIEVAVTLCRNLVEEKRAVVISTHDTNLFATMATTTIDCD